MSLPFDWLGGNYPDRIKKTLENDFVDFIPDMKYTTVNKYDVGFAHFDTDIEKGTCDYMRQIERFRNIIKTDLKIYFIFINEDYLYSEYYRNKDFNDKLFLDMCILEQYFVENYTNINFNILYFDYCKHTLPINSNIIQILLSSTTLYDNHELASDAFIDFRKYCGKILSKIFGTNNTGNFQHFD
jgi:hypothetical protein